MNERQTIEQEIRNLQCDLTASDYKVIKCSEAQLLGNEMPYDITEVFEERQAIRNRINELQAELEALED